jgi:hypothetical protein
MRFFTPLTEEADKTEQVLNKVRTSAASTTGWTVTDRRIFRIAFRHNGKDLVDEVGKPDPSNGEVVIAILESNAFLVCTHSRGVDWGTPLLVGHDDAYSIADFEPDEASSC